MKRNIVKAARRFVLLALLATALTQQALANSHEGDRSYATPITTLATNNFALAQGQSGYWARVIAGDATVRDRSGGRVLQVLTNGQFFHVYPSYKNSSWLLGYACPNGNRGGSNPQSTPGYIMRNTVSSAVAMTSPAMPASVDEASLVAITAGTDNSSLMRDAFYVSALSVGVILHISTFRIVFKLLLGKRKQNREAWWL